MTSFWTTATTEQRLAQIRGGISLNMTTKQVAMNCGISKSMVWHFANEHGLHFDGESVGKDRQSIAASTWTRRYFKHSELGDPAAFELFGHHHPKPSLFEPHPLDEAAL